MATATAQPTSAAALLEAIDGFLDEHADSEDHRDLVETLGDLRDRVGSLDEAAADEDLSPGRRSAREAAEEEPRRREPEAERYEERDEDDGAEPRSYAEARERAKDRFSRPSPKRDEREGSKTPEARDREVTAEGDRGLEAA